MKILDKVRDMRTLPEADRVDIYNQIVSAASELIEDIATDPVVSIKLVAADRIEPNDYNPNRVAAPEMELLQDSIDADGVTIPLVVIENGRGGYTVVDGFHRYEVLVNKLKKRYIPCSVIRSDAGGRIASTIRHNRARGKHQVDLMVSIVKTLLNGENWDDEMVMRHLGMSEDELVRFKQVAGVAKLLAGSEYSLSWGAIDE